MPDETLHSALAGAPKPRRWQVLPTSLFDEELKLEHEGQIIQRSVAAYLADEVSAYYGEAIRDAVKALERLRLWTQDGCYEGLSSDSEADLAEANHQADTVLTRLREVTEEK